MLLLHFHLPFYTGWYCPHSLHSLFILCPCHCCAFYHCVGHGIIGHSLCVEGYNYILYWWHSIAISLCTVHSPFCYISLLCLFTPIWWWKCDVFIVAVVLTSPAFVPCIVVFCHALHPVCCAYLFPFVTSPISLLLTVVVASDTLQSALSLFIQSLFYSTIYLLGSGTFMGILMHSLSRCSAVTAAITVIVVCYLPPPPPPPPLELLWL